MSASRPGSMRGPRVKTPPLLLLLLLLSALTGSVLCQEEEDAPADPEPEATETEGEEEAAPEDGGDPEITDPLPTEPDATVEPDPSPTEVEPGYEIVEDDLGSGQSRSLPVDVDDSPTEEQDTTGPTVQPGDEEEALSPVIILIPVVLVVVIIGMIVCGIFINRRWNKNVKSQELRKEDPYLDGSSTEKVPMPMFEEDVPSVLELEMEELGQWMKKDGETAEDAKQP